MITMDPQADEANLNNCNNNYSNKNDLKPRETYFKDIDKLFDEVRQRINANRIYDGDLDHYLDELQHGFTRILETSSVYEYKNLPANGFITYCVMLRKLIQFILEKGHFESDEWIDDLKIVLKGFSLLKTLLLHFDAHQSLKKTDDTLSTVTTAPNNNNNNNNNDTTTVNNETTSRNLPLVASDMEETLFQLGQFFKSTGFQEALARSFNSFWLSSKTRVLMAIFRGSLSWSYVNFFKSFRVLSNRRYRSRAYVKLANQANMRFPFDMATAVDSHLSRKFCRNILWRNKDAVGSNFRIPAQGQWFVPERGPGIVQVSPPMVNRNPIRCRLIRHRSKPLRKDVLMFHCHGSGFVVSRPEIHDAYLKPWIALLDGVSVLSVDYSLMTKYPRQFQDVLDAYLWLTSGDPSVEEKIGFQPKKIIIVGDSAGSMLGVSLLILLTEISKKCKTTDINMPRAMVSFYGTFHLTGAWSSSKIMSLFDPILHYGNVLALAGCLSGIQGDVSKVKVVPKNRIAKVSAYIAEDMKLMKRTLLPRNVKPWYLDENGQPNPKEFQRMHEILQSPYLNCPSFTNYHLLKDVAIYLISSFGCIFLDDNIELAKAWKGPVEVHVLEGQIHGFLFLRHEKAAIDFCNKKIVEIVNKVASESD